MEFGLVGKEYLIVDIQTFLLVALLITFLQIILKQGLNIIGLVGMSILWRNKELPVLVLYAFVFYVYIIRRSLNLSHGIFSYFL